MATSDHLRRPRTVFRIIAIAVILAGLAATGLALATQPAAGQASVTMGDLSVPDANTTAEGNVSDVRLTVDAGFEYDVPDADRVIVELAVGPSASELETVAFRQPTAVQGQHSGSASFDASVLDASAYTASDFQPPVAGNVTKELVVALTLEVRRTNGDPVTATVTEPVTLTIHDDATLSASVGGVGNVSVVTN